jgi:hypothetical protein
MEKSNRRRLLWSIVGLTLGLVIGYLWLREPSSLLTTDRLDEARRRWQQQGPASYVLEVETKGAVGATHRIVVREGEVVEMTTGGRTGVLECRWSVRLSRHRARQRRQPPAGLRVRRHGSDPTGPFRSRSGLSLLLSETCPGEATGYRVECRSFRSGLLAVASHCWGYPCW